MRIGYGYDSHVFDSARTLRLAGIDIPGSPGLCGHSDADVVVHAVIAALLGAVGLGDIGTHFPPDDDTWKEADSMDLLVRTMTMVGDAGFQVGNVDLTVICEEPKLGPHKVEMATALARALGVEVSDVSVKAKTNEGMGWEGRGEGIAVHTVALLFRSPE